MGNLSSFISPANSVEPPNVSLPSRKRTYSESTSAPSSALKKDRNESNVIVEQPPKKRHRTKFEKDGMYFGVYSRSPYAPRHGIPSVARYSMDAASITYYREQKAYETASIFSNIWSKLCSGGSSINSDVQFDSSAHPPTIIRNESTQYVMPYSTTPAIHKRVFELRHS